ncbi:hypothetical protein D3874_27560 [Oleomonas cavernae]|uniref:Uncharacterized protein n=1 Tax=Oleomonas cavernae TaxID=2320859 RepID=A0A418VTG8_9PROT|nr:hypothetical protein D3874_27560 [Oleomonas cavernae]
MRSTLGLRGALAPLPAAAPFAGCRFVLRGALHAVLQRREQGLFGLAQLFLRDVGAGQAAEEAGGKATGPPGVGDSTIVDGEATAGAAVILFRIVGVHSKPLAGITASFRRKHTSDEWPCGRAPGPVTHSSVSNLDT